MGDGATEINKAGEEVPMSLLGLDLWYCPTPECPFNHLSRKKITKPRIVGNPAVNIKACILNTDTVSIIL